LAPASISTWTANDPWLRPDQHRPMGHVRVEAPVRQDQLDRGSGRVGELAAEAVPALDVPARLSDQNLELLFGAQLWPHWVTRNQRVSRPIGAQSTRRSTCRTCLAVRRPRNRLAPERGSRTVLCKRILPGEQPEAHCGGIVRGLKANRKGRGLPQTRLWRPPAPCRTVGRDAPEDLPRPRTLLYAYDPDPVPSAATRRPGAPSPSDRASVLLGGAMCHRPPSNAPWFQKNHM